MTRGAGADPGAVPPARAIFFGSGGFALAILDAVRSAPELDLVGVISTPDRPAGRRGEPHPTPVAAAARAAGLPLLQPDRLRDPAAVAAISALAPTLGILADYGRIIPPAVLGAIPRGILNVHPSLLPRHRGATPIPAAILSGDSVLGVSLIELVDQLDAGPVVAVRSWPAQGDETASGLEATTSAAGAALLAENIGPWLAGRLPAQPQQDATATLTRPLRREDGRIDAALPTAQLERQVRAYEGWPGTFFVAGPHRIAILEARAVRPEIGWSGGSDLPGLPATAPAPGALLPFGDGIALATSDGFLELVRVQPAGGRPMSAAELRRGRPSLLAAAVEP